MTHFMISVMLFHMGQFDKAIEQYRLVIKFSNSKINNFNENIGWKNICKICYSIIAAGR